MSRKAQGFLKILAGCCIAFLLPPLAMAQETVLRIGYFPNITHAHALVAQNMARGGEGWFEQRLPGVKLEWTAFNAGPSAMEAMFADTVDITYVGPNPALNAYLRSKGKDVRVVSGAVRGGAALIVPGQSALKAPSDFKGKRIATPQLGNTQDIACRYWLKQAGLNVTMSGGDAFIIPTPNATIFSLFSTGQIDAAWTVEPWVSRLEMEAGGKIVYSEPMKDSLTTILASSFKNANERRELLRGFVKAHSELTQWIAANPDAAQSRVADELTRQTRREFPLALVQHAWPRLVFSNDITLDNFTFSMEAARSAGFIKQEVDLTGIILKP